MNAAPGALIVGRYRVEGLLGSGGMGAVYRCTDTASLSPAGTAPQVAVKVIKHDDPELTSRFRREIAVMQQLHGDNLVRVYDAGEVDGALFIAMELVDGVSLRQRLADGDGLPVDEALRMVRDVARALDVAHGAGVMHRDVKPANIVLSKQEDGSSRAVLLDFGIARSQDPGATMTSTGLVVGTAGYIAPEVGMGGRSWDARSDIYSLGVVMYEALVGAPPFVAANPMALLARHASEDPIPPSTREPAVPEAVSALTMRLMARDPQRRPANAVAVIEAVTALLEGRATLLQTSEGEAVEEHNDFFEITWEAATRLVRVARTSKAYERAEDAGAIYAAMRDAYPVANRIDKALLIDARAAPARTDSRFAKIVAAELPLLMQGWRRVASLVQTEEGLHQIINIRQRAGIPHWGAFMDEDAALAYLLGENE